MRERFFNIFDDLCIDEMDRDEKYERLKLRLEELHGKENKRILVVCTVILGILMWVTSFSIRYELLKQTISFGILSGFTDGFVAGGCIYLFGIIVFDIKAKYIKRELLQYKANAIQDKVQEDIFENSIKMSYKYLDQYYLQTRSQAQKGFYTTVCISVLGALLIGAGIIMMFLQLTEPSYVTCASGVITEFIAAIFFYLYNRTITSMSKYHNKLVLSHNISIALRVADSLPEEDKVKAKDMIISELLKDINSFLIRSDLEDKA